MAILLYSLKTKKYIIQALIYFVFFLIMYFMLDYLNLPYKQMAIEYSNFLVISNVFLNIIMAVLSSILLVSSDIMIRGTRASSLGFFAILFGIFTYGCTPCVIALLANFGIIFSVMALPFAGLPYKFISLALIGIGLFFTIRQLTRGCKVKPQKK